MFEVDDKVIVKKTHPCGNNVFTIIRQGADYKIKCDKCGRIILMTYDELKKCVKKQIKRKLLMNEDNMPLKKSKGDRAWIILIVVLIVLIVFVLGLKLFILARVEIKQTSMENTLFDGDKIWVNRCKKPKENDIVVFKKDGDYLIKRVIAVSGDSIKIENGLLYIKKSGENEYSLKNEDYIKEPMNTFKDMSETTISEDCIFVMGDNRNVSLDSRDFGEISTKDCIGIKI